jgi:uncharacterized protein YecE (DUF72 family)
LNGEPEPQPELFGPAPAAPSAAARLVPAAVPDELHRLAAELQQRFGGRLHLGTSSWHFTGWSGLVWAREYGAPMLSKRGLTAYGQHPLLNCVSLDRAFYRPLEASTYAELASQVPPRFRFVVKAASMVADATLREAQSGKALRPNPLFLDAPMALQHCVQPALEGLREKFGALVFQLSPLPVQWLDDEAALHARLDALFSAVTGALPAAVRVALEVRDPTLLTPALARLLKRHGVRYCAGLHDRMPPIADQLPLLRALWPGDLVCRWSLQRGLKYTQAKGLWEPFDRLQAPDLPTRENLARVIVGTLAAGFSAFVTINNKAEGSAPWSVIELAREVLRLARQATAPGCR